MINSAACKNIYIVLLPSGLPRRPAWPIGAEAINKDMLQRAVSLSVKQARDTFFNT